MTDVVVSVETAEWLLQSDTTDPHGSDFGGDIATAFELLAPMQLSWRIDDVLPPVNQPASASFRIYDSGHHFIIDGRDSFAPINVGDPIGVYVSVQGMPGGDLCALQGRVADLQADNHPAGGVVYSVVVVDRLADYASTLAPETLSAASGVNADDYYDQLIAAESLDLNYTAGAAQPKPFYESGNDLDLTNVSVLSALSLLVQNDMRGTPFDGPFGRIDPLSLVPRYLALDVDAADSTPVAVPSMKLEEYDTTNDDIAGVLEFSWTGSQWVLAVADYYDGVSSDQGMVFTADQLLRDLGSWRKTRQAAINTVEAQGVFHPTAFGGTPVTKTKRVSLPELVSLYGRNTRTFQSPAFVAGEAGYIAGILLGRPELVQRGWGLERFTLLWDQLTSDQLMQSWATLLWPQYTGTLGGILGRAVAITGVPDSWRLSDGLVVAGRLLGIDFNIAGERVQLDLTMRGVPPVTQTAGITYTQLDALTPGDVTYANIDPSISLEQLTLVGP